MATSGARAPRGRPPHAGAGDRRRRRAAGRRARGRARARRRRRGERTTADRGLDGDASSDTTDDRRSSDTTDDEVIDTSDTTDGSSDTTDGSSDTTDGSSDTTTDDDATTTTDDDATTTTAPDASTTTLVDAGPPPAPPSTVVPPAITSVSQAAYPPDAATLRATLDAFGFPAWWPVPDAYAVAGDPNPTVQDLNVRDSLVRYDGPLEGTTDWNTTWLDPNPDIDAAEATWTAKLPADRFDIVGGIEDKSATTQGGETSYAYTFEGIGSEDGYLLFDVRQVFDDAGAPLGVTVDAFYSGPYTTAPDPIPVGSGGGKQFLALAPASNELRWESTSFSVDAFVFASAAYEATFLTDATDVDAVVASLSDPASFPGDLRIVSPGRYEFDDYWTQAMAYGDLAGEYSLIKPGPGDTGDVYVTLRFDLD